MLRISRHGPNIRQGLALLCLVAVLASCGQAPATQPNVLLIVIDTLRADHLGAYGYRHRDTSPAIDQFAKRATRFTRAYATAGWTRPSVGSILTGLPPASHGANTIWNHLHPDVETLAESFKAAGYSTAGVVSNRHLLKKIGFAQGFDLWDESQAQGAEHISSHQINGLALSMLDELDSAERPWFLFVHYFDPHYQYLDHESFDFAPSGAPLFDGSEAMKELEDSVPSWSPGDREFLIGRYDEEIRLTDQAIGELLQQIESRPTSPDTLIAITADHGEEFGEHGSVGHINLHDEVIRVPLLIQQPDGDGICDVAETVSLLSLAPRLLELAGIAYPKERYPAPSLTGCHPQVPGRGQAFSESQKQRAVIDGDYKLIVDRERDTPRIYNLKADPAETRNVAPAKPAVRRHLMQLLARNQQQTVRRQSAAPEVGERQLRFLQELGYIEEEPAAEASR